jgi:CBS domain-containing protein
MNLPARRLAATFDAMSASTQSFAPGQTAADLMLRDPKTLPIDATVRDVRAVLDDPKVQMVLLADGASFGAGITELPNDADPGAPARAFASPDVETMSPDDPAGEAFDRTNASPHRRVVVVDDDGKLLGLLCLNAARTHFCRSTNAAS